MSKVQSLVEAILEKARGIARSETLIGDPITFEGVLVIPVVEVSIGFGAGGGEGVSGAKSEGQGAGGGIKVAPSCFLVHDGTTVRVIPAKPSKAKGMDALVEKLPDLLTYAMDSLRGHGDKTEPEEEEIE